MRWINEADVKDQLESVGLIIDAAKGLEVLPLGKKSIRCKVDKMGTEKRGWYRLFEFPLDSGDVILCGSYGYFSGDDKSNVWTIELSKNCNKCGTEMGIKAKKCPSCGAKLFRKRELTPEQQAALKARIAEDRKRAEEERKAENERAAQWATAVWRASREATPGDHDYITRKHLSATGGARIFEGNAGIKLEGAEDADYKYLGRFRGALLVPMCDAKGRVCGLQFIMSRAKHSEWIKNNDRDKTYWPRGLDKQAHYWMIGGTPGKVCLVAEGFATAVSLNEATGLPVAVAFDAGNMLAVGQAVRKNYRNRVRMLYCADDDWLQKCEACGKYTTVKTELCIHCGEEHKKGNAGVTRSTEAAIATEGAWVMPTFATPRPDNRKGPTDFNDLHELEGLQVVRAQIEQKLAALDWGAGVFAPTPAIPAQRAGTPPGGEGGAGGESNATAAEREPALALMQIDDAVERFIPLDDGTGKFLFDKRAGRIVLRDQMLALLPAGERWDDVKRHPLWGMRGAYYLDQVGFDPSGRDPEVKLNTWRGWPRKPVAGKCDAFLSLIEYLCKDDPCADVVYQWLLCWMAYPLQHPGAKMQSAVIMHGPQGTGKSTVFKTLARIYGAGMRLDYSVILDQKALQDNFNADWENKLICVAEEVVNNADKWQLKNELKELVTGEWIRIRKVFTDAYRQRNQINFVFLSNETQPLPLDNDDRRHLVIWTPPELGEDFYDEVQFELENGGLEAFYDYLMRLDLSGFHPKKRPPMTDAKRALIHISLPSEERFVAEWQSGETGLPFCACGSMDLYAGYKHWCTRNGVRNPRESNQFLGQFKKLNGWTNQSRHVFDNANYAGKTISQRMVVPSAEALEKAAATGRDHRHAIGTEKARWLTDGFFIFRTALEALPK